MNLQKKNRKPCQATVEGLKHLDDEAGIAHQLNVLFTLLFFEGLSLRALGYSSKGYLLLKVAMIANKFWKILKNSKTHQKTTEKINPRIPKQIPPSKKKEKTEQIPSQKKTINIFKRTNKFERKKWKNRKQK